MAKKAQSTSSGAMKKTHKKRPGVHSKKKMSKIKASKNYKKLYRGQGK